MLNLQSQIQPSEVSSGTVDPARYRLSEKEQFVVIRSIQMLAGDVVLTAIGNEARVRRPAQRESQSPIDKSLERSLIEHADVWAELAKY